LASLLSCSGGMYAGVPIKSPVCVSRRSSASVRRARPKSMITGCFDGVIMMFDGFRSRWMTPLAWASAMARASWRTTAATARGGNCCPERMNFDSGRPSR
jgi:hypothetical protein